MRCRALPMGIDPASKGMAFTAESFRRPMAVTRPTMTIPSTPARRSVITTGM